MKTQERNQQPVLEQIVTHAGRRIRETAAGVGAGLQERLGKAGIKISNVRGSVVDTTKKYSKKADTYVKKNPWTSVGVISGFAFLVGVFVGRRRSD